MVALNLGVGGVSHFIEPGQNLEIVNRFVSRREDSPYVLAIEPDEKLLPLLMPNPEIHLFSLQLGWTFGQIIVGDPQSPRNRPLGHGSQRVALISDFHGLQGVE